MCVDGWLCFACAKVAHPPTQIALDYFDDLFADIATLQQTDERLWCVFQSLSDVFEYFDVPGDHFGRHLSEKSGVSVPRI